MTRECEQLLAWLRRPGTVVYLSGEAGTGKSYQIGEVIRHWPKPKGKDDPPYVAVAAPTGLAAERVGGETIHQLLGIPIKRFGLRYSENGLLRTAKDAFVGAGRRDLSLLKARVRALQLLIIDEVSMVRCDLMEVIEARLRMLRENDQPFGGLSLLLVGDLHQLPPVSDKIDKEYILETGHRSLYFFDARCFSQKTVPIRFMELKEIRRVQMSRRGSLELRRMLHEIREGVWTDETRSILRQRYELSRESFRPSASDKYITTHRLRAAIINEWMLHYLPGPFVSLAPQAKGEGLKLIDELPTLLLKVGAPVMFTESDMSLSTKGKRRFYKGTFGTVSRIMTDHLIIAIPEADGRIREEKVIRERWRMSERDGTLRRLNPQAYKRATDYVSQYPIELAWAITIHKAQGCSLENVFIDTEEVFESGQLYVALSRATHLGGLHMLSPAEDPEIDIDPNVRRFEELMRGEGVPSDPAQDPGETP